MGLYLLNKRTRVIYGPYSQEEVDRQMSDPKIKPRYDIFQGSIITTEPQGVKEETVKPTKKQPTAKDDTTKRKSAG